MGDIGPGPPELVEKRLETELKRLDYGIASQELELLEIEDRKRRVKQNIEALKLERNEKLTALAATRDQAGEKE